MKIASNAVIVGTHRLRVLLALLFTSMIRHSKIPNILNLSKLIPIPKDKKKSLSDSDNYRAIGPCSVFMKILDYIILNQFSYAFETSEQQFAYKANVSPTICSYLATETIQYYLNANSTVRQSV